MKPTEKVKSELDRKYQKVAETSAGFDFFSAIHDFVEHIELNPALSEGLSSRVKLNRDGNIPAKYNHLKQIYQGIEDVHRKPGVDLGHARYMAIIELDKIKNKQLSENNPFWKKRELFRKLAGDIYGRLNFERVA